MPAGSGILALMRDGVLRALPVVPAPLAYGDLAVLAGPGEALARVTAPAR